ncbi:MAG TPA: glycosyltransferase family 87 protein [Bacteroidia bacterium]|nr:glycosyltransferase family 87 protein [Bacteroidia bacterium]
MGRISSNFRNNPFYPVLGLLLALFFASLFFGERFFLHDFEVYYSASNAFLKGNPVYGTAFGLSSGFFKYTPVTLYLFIPLALLPFTVAKICFYLFVSLATRACFKLCSHIVSSGFFRDTRLVNPITLWCVLVISGPHLFRELELGNVNMLLLLVFSLAFLFLKSGREGLAGILIGLGILVKLHFLLLIPLLLLRKKYKTVLAFSGMVCAGMLLPFLLNGMTRGALLNKQWIHAVAEHNNSMLAYPDTLYSIVYRFGIRFVHPEPFAGFVPGVLALVAILFGTRVWIHLKQERTERAEGRSPGNYRFTFEWCFLLALVPNITATDTEHFLYSIPLLIFSVQALLEFRNRILLGVFVLFSFLSYGDPGSDVLGKSLSEWLELHGSAGIGNVAVLVCSLLLFRKWAEKQQEPQQATPM